MLLRALRTIVVGLIASVGNLITLWGTIWLIGGPGIENPDSQPYGASGIARVCLWILIGVGVALTVAGFGSWLLRANVRGAVFFVAIFNGLVLFAVLRSYAT